MTNEAQAQPQPSTSLEARPLHADTALSSGNAWKEEIGRWGALIKSKGLPKHVTTPAMAIAIVRYGQEYGWGPMRSLNSIYVVNGTPSLRTECMLGLVREKLKEAEIVPVEMSAEVCRLKARRHPDEEWIEFKWTIEDARRAGLAGKDIWKKYPEDLLYWRTASRVCRRLFSDVTQGLYTYEEVTDWEGSGGSIQTVDVIPPHLQAKEADAIEGEFVEQPPDVGAEPMDGDELDDMLDAVEGRVDDDA